jgi:hypothetical protein
MGQERKQETWFEPGCDGMDRSALRGAPRLQSVFVLEALRRDGVANRKVSVPREVKYGGDVSSFSAGSVRSEGFSVATPIRDTAARATCARRFLRSFSPAAQPERHPRQKLFQTVSYPGADQRINRISRSMEEILP